MQYRLCDMEVGETGTIDIWGHYTCFVRRPPSNSNSAAMCIDKFQSVNQNFNVKSLLHLVFFIYLGLSAWKHPYGSGLDTHAQSPSSCYVMRLRVGHDIHFGPFAACGHDLHGTFSKEQRL
jgi:hypothetical protein